MFSSALGGCRGERHVRGDFSAQRGTREGSPLQRIHVAFGERGDSPPGRHESSFIWLTAFTGEPGTCLLWLLLPLSLSLTTSSFWLISLSSPLFLSPCSWLLLCYFCLFGCHSSHSDTLQVSCVQTPREKVWLRCTHHPVQRVFGAGHIPDQPASCAVQDGFRCIKHGARLSETLGKDGGCDWAGPLASFRVPLVACPGHLVLMIEEWIRCGNLSWRSSQCGEGSSSLNTRVYAVWWLILLIASWEGMGNCCRMVVGNSLLKAYEISKGIFLSGSKSAKPERCEVSWCA